MSSIFHNARSNNFWEHSGPSFIISYLFFPPFLWKEDAGLRYIESHPSQFAAMAASEYRFSQVAQPKQNLSQEMDSDLKGFNAVSPGIRYVIHRGVAIAVLIRGSS